MTRPFRFKQFTVKQEKAPMKVGTDSVLLGAWCDGANSTSILDLGTGTGLLALMMAQRFSGSRITAIEVNPDAYDEATNNVVASPWADRIRIIHQDLADYDPTEEFDLIIANPPFFHSDLKSPEAGKATARHAAHFDIKGFAGCTRWLNPYGILAGVYPVDIFQKFKSEMDLVGFYLKRIMEVHPTPEKPPHRVLFEFSTQKMRNTDTDSIVIESEGRHAYSEKYRELTEDFYLNF